MKFLALLKKELRQCLPWLIAAALLLLIFGFMVIRLQESDRYDWRYRVFETGRAISTYQLEQRSQLLPLSPLLLLSSLGLGLTLAIVQFWIPFFTKTWGFELQRPVRRTTILLARIFAAAIAFIVSVGLIWLLLYSYAARPGVWFVPPTERVFIEGWIFIALGFIAYLGAALCGLSSAKWYTTKIFGLAFAAFILFGVMLEWRITAALIWLVLGAFILLTQITYTFANREF